MVVPYNIVNDLVNIAEFIDFVVILCNLKVGSQIWIKKLFLIALLAICALYRLMVKSRVEKLVLIILL